MPVIVTRPFTIFFAGGDNEFLQIEDGTMPMTVSGTNADYTFRFDSTSAEFDMPMTVSGTNADYTFRFDSTSAEFDMPMTVSST